MSAPAFVISFDFELRWGVHDRLGLDRDAYRRELEGAREAVPGLLAALASRRLRATWATVGALACRDWSEYFRRSPAPPRYEDRRFAIDPRYADLDPDGTLHFAPELVEQIARTPGQELGTHTFSHLPLREPGVSAADLDADLAAVVRLWNERFAAAPRSLTFPRNQTAFVDVVRARGIRAFRGNPPAWYHDRNDPASDHRPARLLRLADDVFPWHRRAARPEREMVPASLFVRFDLPSALWRLQVARVRHELGRLRPGEAFHVWWHPHNLGADVGARLARACEILDVAAEHVASGRVQSCSMGDLAA